MNTNASNSAPTIRTRRKHLPLATRLLPEGPVIFLLLLGINVCAALSVQRSDWNHLIIPVAVAAGLGVIAGTVLARAGVLDTVSHLVSLLFGASVSFLLVLSQAEAFGPSLQSRVRPVIWHVRDWYLGNNSPQQNDDIVLSLLLGLIAWMLAYLSAWVLFRRGWLLFALLFPAIPLLVNLGYAKSPDGSYVVVFLLLAVPLAARHHLYRKQVIWSRLQMAGPRSLGFRFLSIGAVLAILVTSAGWNAPDTLSHDSLQPLFSQMGQQVESARRSADQWLQRQVEGDGNQQIESNTSYSDFQDSFSIGGGLNLSNQPEVLVTSDRPEYLVAQHYNVYSGRGWSSDVEDTFNPIGKNGKRYAPAMSFQAGQRVILSADVSASRGVTQAGITPLTPLPGVMLTIDTYLASSIDSSVRMSWVQLNDAEFALDTGDLSAIPPDLARIAAMLQSTSFTEKEGPYGPASSDQQVENRLEQEREALAKRFLEVRWEADADGGVTSLIVSGQIPIYDDVESVSPQVNVQANSTYLVRGSETTATEDELRGASTTLPDWVVQRYLQLPDTISTRTAELASEITADAPTAYDKARAVETYLRQAITYDTSIEAPPGDQDVVDYLLFEDPRGYCEQYATAMAVMLRSIGIPARIVSGYAPGDFDEERGGYLYLQSNAHAWVEVFFPGYGWVPFEPTSSESPRTLGDDAASGDIPEDQQIEEIEPTATAEKDDDFAAVSTPESSAGQGLAPIEEVDDDRGGGGDLAVMIGGALLTIVAVGGMAWWMWMRRLRGLSLSAGLFARLVRVGRMMGVSKQPSATPREYAQNFSQRAPVVSEYAQCIVDAYELDQYAQHGSEGRAIETARQAWRRARTKLLPAMLRRALPHRNKRQR